MDELITVNFDTQTVSARDLYDLLSQEDGVKGTERFSKWFERYSGYGFVQGVDFSTPNKKVRVQIEGTRKVQREVDDIDMSVDMAKQICMLQRTEKGKEIRQYLIDYDMILQCKDLIATTVIAKDYGMSAKKFNAMLHDMGIQFKQGDTWVLYSKYQGNGYLKVKTHNYPDSEGVQHSKEHSYWTQKGRLFLYDFLKQDDILPLIEREQVA